MRRGELADKSFTCLPGCGFCCTFQPEVSTVELRGLSKTLPFVPLSAAGGRTYLALQAGHGACALLKDRQCTAYEARPSHCRFFPFHVYWGEEAEVHVDLSCRGVVAAPGASLDAAFASSGAERAAAEKGAEEAVAARRAHRRFRELARAEDAWTEPAPALARLAERAPRVGVASELEALAREAGEEAGADDLAAQALEPFEAPVRDRPFWVDPGMRWLTGERDGDALAILEMQEDGRLEPRGRVDALGRHEEPPAPVRDALAPYVRLLLARQVFRDSAFARVDDHKYAFGVEQALAARAVEIASDLALRVRLVRAVLPAADARAVADEAARFYDADFLDTPAIGAFL